MEIQQDFKELLELFNDRKVDYIIVGAFALAFHGVPRFTGDLDIYVKPDGGNAEKILAALRDFGFESLDIKTEDLTSDDKVLQLGYPPVRIDLITSISGVDWSEASSGIEIGEFNGLKAVFLGRKELIQNKRATGRKKDLADLEALGEE